MQQVKSGEVCEVKPRDTMEALLERLGPPDRALLASGGAYLGYDAEDVEAGIVFRLDGEGRVLEWSNFIKRP